MDLQNHPFFSPDVASFNFITVTKFYLFTELYLNRIAQNVLVCACVCVFFVFVIHHSVESSILPCVVGVHLTCFLSGSLFSDYSMNHLLHCGGFCIVFLMCVQNNAAIIIFKIFSVPMYAVFSIIQVGLKLIEHEICTYIRL